jgi:predicted nucleotidyltransferase
MKIAGIIAEYNPFHNGHAHQIERTRAVDNGCEATHIVAVMSGNFVQRGDVAVLPKAYRVQAALAGGVDLVLELPLPWAMASAEAFAFGAVSILDGLGCVDTISFGSECGRIEQLERAVSALESDRFSHLLHYHLDGGIAFPEARQRAIAEIAGQKTAALLDTANNTLGIEYIKALHRLDSNIRPYTVPRFGAGHDDGLPVGDMASGSFLRSLLAASRFENAMPYIPPAARTVLFQALQKGHSPGELTTISGAILSSLRQLTKEDLSALPGISEGLENRIYEAIRAAGSFDDLCTRIKTRRYVLTRIRRILLSGFLGLQAGWETTQPPYIRVLGTNTRGAEILRAAKSARIPILSRTSKLDTLGKDAQEVFSLESRAADLYGLSLPSPLPCGTEYTNGILRVE